MMGRSSDSWRGPRQPVSDEAHERDWRLLVWGVLALGFLLVVATAARADAGAGTLSLRTAQGELSAPWLSTEIDARVSGLIAQVTVRQRFINDRAEWVEATYLFPLPADSAVHALRMRIGERVIEGEVHEREQARAAYAQAREQGHRASLVEQARPNVFKMAVANLAPYDTIEVELVYLQTLHYDAGRFSLRFPMTVAPRYEPGTVATVAENASTTDAASLASSVEPAGSEVTMPVLPAEDDERALASVHVVLDAGFALARLDSPYHAIRVQRDGRRYSVDLAAGKVPMDRDFELQWQPDVGTRPGAALFTETLDGETYALLMLVPNARRDSLGLAREMIFVIDTSGSMEGTALAQAKAALAFGLAELGANDRFNVIQFNSFTAALYDLPVANGATARAQALDYIEALDADGGTEMAPALAAAFEGAAPRGYLRQVVFVTDGGIANEDALLTQIGAQLGDARLFTVAIGAAPNAFFMRKAAELGRGTFTFIGSEGEVGAKMQALFGKLGAPALTDVEVEWPVAAEAWPARVPDVYAGEPVVVSARLSRLSGALVVRGRLGDAPWSAALPLAADGGAEGVATVWARSKIESLMDAERSGAVGAKDEIVEVALRHRLVTRYTSFVAVDRTPARPQPAAWRASEVPSLLPAATIGGDSVGYPPTATSMPLHALASLLLWCAASGLLPFARRR
jgi:Ca-activated chloride channel homolog